MDFPQLVVNRNAHSLVTLVLVVVVNYPGLIYRHSLWDDVKTRIGAVGGQ